MVDKPIWEIVRKSTRYVYNQNGNSRIFPMADRFQTYLLRWQVRGSRRQRHFRFHPSDRGVAGFRFLPHHRRYPSGHYGDLDPRGSGSEDLSGSHGPNTCVAKDPAGQQIGVADSQARIFRLDPATKKWTTSNQ